MVRATNLAASPSSLEMLDQEVCCLKLSKLKPLDLNWIFEAKSAETFSKFTSIGLDLQGKVFLVESFIFFYFLVYFPFII